MSPDTRERILLPLLLAVIVMAITLFAYANTLNNSFVWDTTFYLEDHESHISNLAFDNLKWMLTAREFSNWHPVTWLSWALDYQLYDGLNTRGFHLSNNILHGFNSVLVFVLTLVVFGLGTRRESARPVPADINALIAAVLAALIFALHPQHVESVAWVAERKDLLCQFFTLLALLAYWKYVTGKANVRARWYLGSLFVFILALMSKPMAVTFPAILLLLDIYPLRRSTWLRSGRAGVQTQTFKRLMLEKVPFFLLSALLALLTLSVQQGAMVDVPVIVRILNAFHSIMIYTSKLLIPLSFSPHYPFFVDPGQIIAWEAYIPIFGFLAITGTATLAWFRGHRAWLVSWLFFLVGLSPVLGLIAVGTQGFADRYVYFPTLPFYFLIGAGILMVLDGNGSNRRYLIIPAVLAIAVILAHKTSQQTLIWRSELTLWGHSVMTYPQDPIARNNLGVSQLIAGDYERALMQFNAIETMPVDPTTMLSWRSLANLLLARYEDAILDHEKLQISSRSSPGLVLDQDCLQYNLGWIHAQLNNHEESIGHFRLVNLDSVYHADALTWLDQLDRPHSDNEYKIDAENLPPFCKVLIPQLWG